jgi:hypothetical protein
MNNRVITRERGVIPGCRAPGPDSHMAVDGMGRPWLEVAKLPSTIDAWLASLREETRRSRIARGADPETGIKLVALRSDLAPEQRAEAIRIGRAHRVRQRGREAEGGLVLLSQKAAFGGFENHIWRRFPLERRGLGWVSTKRRILNRGLRAMSRGL